MTAYPEIDAFLQDFSNRLQAILGDHLIGLYLSGSLSYGDFKPDRSDIDLVAITRDHLTANEIKSLKKLHEQLQADHPKWHGRLECSYPFMAMFNNTLAPKEPRPYYNGQFYEAAPYGNEWITNNYLLYHHAIVLIGPEFKTLCKAIDIKDVQAACLRDFLEEWAPKVNDANFLDNPQNQSYLILTLCRILYTVCCGIVGTKTTSATWVKTQFSLWHNLIAAAEDWKEGDTMPPKIEAIGFIQFVAAELQKMPK